MSNSLVIAGQVELLGPHGGVVSTNPRCLGAVFQLLPGQGYGSSVAAGTYDLSAPQPTTDFVASLLTDGERPQGFRASNRTITLPVRITAPSFAVLAGAREVLMELVDQQFWPLTWTRDQGAEQTTYPLVFDCFRANPTTVMWGGPEGLDLHPTGILTLQFTALPYGRSDTQTQMGFAAPVPSSPPPPPAPVVLDAFATINNPQFAPSTTCVVGPNSCFFDPGNSPAGDPDGLQTPLTYGQVFTTPLNLTSMTALQMWLGLSSRKFWHHHGEQGRVRLSVFVTLTDTFGNTLMFSRSSLRLPVSDAPQVPRFSRVSIGIPQGNTVFAYVSVASYSLTIINQSSPRCLRYTLAYLDALTAYPPSATTAPVVRGNLYWLYGVKGTARSPVSMSFQGAPAAGTPSTFTTPTNSGVYTVPNGTVYLKVEGIGGGGAGAGQTGAGFGGGGGGGEYAQEPIFAATPGQLIPYVVGAGGVQGATEVDGQDTVFGPVPGGTQVLIANGGNSALQNSTGGGLGGVGSTNPIHYTGGLGRTASGSVGGGGGSSASAIGVGNTPLGSANVTLSGSGNWAAPAGVTMVTVTAIGGGGGAGSGGVGNGSGGGGGESATQTFTVVPLSSYAYVCGAGGAGGGSAGDLPGANGADSTFIVGAVTLRAQGGRGGPSSTHTVSGGLGGNASTAPTHFAGGQGGATGPYPGSGASSAGPAVAGNAGSPYHNAGATAPAGGGGGGTSSGPASGTGGAGAVPGGGGGATWTAGFAGGAGGNGNITISYPGGAPTNNGAAAPSGGGAGGAGGASANTPGSAGTAPGGGGGGADSSGTSEVGGAGGAGKLVITPYASAAFKTLLVHRPKYGCNPSYVPLVGVGNGADAPDGTHFYTIPQPQSGQNASFDGTYTVVLIASSFNAPTNARTITVTVTQTEYSGGPSYSQSTVPVTVSPGLASVTGPGNQVNNGVLIAGVLTLPVKALAYDNTGAFFQVSVTDTNTSDRFLDCLLLDTQGQSLIINEPSAGYLTYYLDEPDPLHDLGLYLGTQSTRANAVSVVDAIQAVSGGPFVVEPKECLLFAYSADGNAPSIGLSYYDRYFFDRLAI